MLYKSVFLTKLLVLVLVALILAAVVLEAQPLYKMPAVLIFGYLSLWLSNGRTRRGLSAYECRISRD